MFVARSLDAKEGLIMPGHAGSRETEICVVGLGYVGLPLAVCLAEAGYTVIGVEKDLQHARRICYADDEFREPNLRSHLNRVIAASLLSVTSRIPPSCRPRIYIVCTGTPVGADGDSDLTDVLAATHEIAAVATSEDLVILRSTVGVGATTQMVCPILRAAAPDVEVAFCPERTLAGAALEELRRLPQIVAGFTPRAGDRASILFESVGISTVKVSSPETAEVIKLSANAYRYVSFAFSNEMARLCEAIGVDSHEVASVGAVGYPRATMPVPGPVGGPCLPKDAAILGRAFEMNGLQPNRLVAAATATNESVADRESLAIAEVAYRISLSAPLNIALLGVAFKGDPETDDTRNAPGIELVARLSSVGLVDTIRWHDPLVRAAPQFARPSERSERIRDAIRNASLVIFATNHRVYRQIVPEIICRYTARPSIIFDYWGIQRANRAAYPADIIYIGHGVPESSTLNRVN